MPDAHNRDIRADLGNFTRYVAAWNVRKRDRHAWDAAAHPEIEVIQRASLDAHDGFVRANAGFWSVFILEDFGRAVLMEDDCLHENSPALKWPGYAITATKMCLESTAAKNGKTGRLNRCTRTT